MSDAQKTLVRKAIAERAYFNHLVLTREEEDLIGRRNRHTTYRDLARPYRARKARR